MDLAAVPVVGTSSVNIGLGAEAESLVVDIMGRAAEVLRRE